MNYEELSEIAMEIIINAGAAKSSSMEALMFAKKGDFTTALNLLKTANEFYLKAHEAQTTLIRKEAICAETGNYLAINLMIVHAQDHLTMALMAKDFSEEFINLYQKMEAKND